MRYETKQNNTIWQLIVGSLVVLLLALISASAFARGLRGGGAAGALDDFDLFLQTQTTNGLPANLINGFESSNSIAGDGTVGVGGTFGFDPNQQNINSLSGNSVTLLPGSVNGGSGPRAGFARKLGPDGLPAMLSLKSVPLPQVPELAKFIRNKQAAILLGKALFWDVQAGSDGNACASCHFHAGADNRFKNQLSPGLKANDTTFQATFAGAGGPNYKLKAQDFPFHRLSDPLDRNSAIVFDTNDVVSSQGTFGGTFQQLGPNGKEQCGARPTADTSFNVNGVMTRRVAPRNTPSTINAVFNYRNFWDGRANNSFNGVSPFGSRDANAKVLELLPDGTTVPTTMALRNASLASQAVGPALSDFEMSCANRTFKDLGRKLIGLRPLRLQKVDPTDSVLGAHATPDRHGIKQSYPELIKAAFDPRWWNSTDDFDGYTQMESNFSLYWGLAIMMYESTLISDETPFDRLVGDGTHPADPTALTVSQLRGLSIFRGKGNCLSCHKGAEFTGAATSLQPESGEGSVIESMLLKTGQLAVYDSGFYNIGVRPAAEDRGVGANDPFGNSLSFTRNWFDQLRSRTVADPVWVDPCMFSIFFDATACWIAPDANDTRIVSDGAFKTPSLRNIALTQPYFHNGSYLTLEQVVEFYNRGGNRRGPDDNDTTGFVSADSPNGGTTNVHPAIKPLGLSQNESADLVNFLRHALTDQRVACERAPFDHPSLKLHDGHKGDESSVRDHNQDSMADDKFELLPAVGRNGLLKESCLTNDDGSLVASLPSTTPPGGGTTGTTPPAGTGTTTGTGTVGTGTTGTTGTTGNGTGPTGIGTTGTGNTGSRGSRFAGSLDFGGESKFGSSKFGANSESNESPEIERNNNESQQQIREIEPENHSSPAANMNAPETVLVRSRVTIYGSVSTGGTYVWTQTEGPQVTLSKANTLAPSFTAPAEAATLVFELTASDSNGSTTTFSTINVVTDDVTIHSVSWTGMQDKSKGKAKSQANGRLNVVASSSAINDDGPLPVGMTMTATFWSKEIRAGKFGSATQPVEVPMTLVKNQPGKPRVCVTEGPCFSVDLSDGIVDPKNKQSAPLFVPPSAVVVKSFLGGTKTAKGEAIRIR